MSTIGFHSNRKGSEKNLIFRGLYAIFANLFNKKTYCFVPILIWLKSLIYPLTFRDAHLFNQPKALSRITDILENFFFHQYVENFLVFDWWNRWKKTSNFVYSLNNAHQCVCLHFFAFKNSLKQICFFKYQLTKFQRDQNLLKKPVLKIEKIIHPSFFIVISLFRYNLIKSCY